MSKAQGIANSANQGQFKNRIINGAMMIDQRNAGASISMTDAVFAYAVDRTAAYKSTTASTTAQRSTVAPAGFTNSFLFTTTTGGTVSAGNQNIIQQSIEGFNVADLGWGTANAQPITISFWVRASLTGTYGVGLSNSAANRVYVATYSVSSANTWEYKTITIAGDTTGTWLTDNGIGIRLRFDLGSGSTYQGTAGSWGTTLINTTSAQVSVVGTTGATFYITGVQLEKGSTATSFDYRPYGTELSLCQRYYYRIVAESSFGRFGSSFNFATNTAIGIVSFPVIMRTTPTALEQSGTASNYTVIATSVTTCTGVPTLNANGTNTKIGVVSFATTSGLVAGQASQLSSSSGVSTAYLGWSAEL
jgi:hypothetical protein